MCSRKPYENFMSVGEEPTKYGSYEFSTVLTKNTSTAIESKTNIVDARFMLNFGFMTTRYYVNKDMSEQY